MTTDRAELRRTFPEASQLLGFFGEDYDYDYDKNERLALDDYVWGRGMCRTQAVTELDALMERFPTDEALRAALLALGVKWTIWDEGNDWRPFVLRLRNWLAESIEAEAAEPTAAGD